MKLPAKQNPAHAASTDGTHYILNGVSLEGDLAIATDGRVLFVTKGERDEDDDLRDALIPTRAALAGFKTSPKSSTPPRLVINDEKTVTIIDKNDDRVTVRDIDVDKSRFPNVEGVVPDASKYTLKVGINIKLLTKLAKSFGNDALVLHLDPDGWKDSNDEGYSSPIMVTSATVDSFGVLMPMRHVSSENLKSNRALAALMKRAEQRKTYERELEEEKANEEKAKADAWLAANNTQPTE
jgi:hypothetical protein